jgi:hypothetical protein
MNHYKPDDHRKVSQKIQKIENAKYIVSYDNIPEIKKLYKKLKRKEYSFIHTAYKIRKQSPDKKILVLERDRRAYLGGRIGNATFHGVTVVNGAGVVRKDKDRWVMNLIRELKIPHKSFLKEHQYADTIPNPAPLKKIFTLLKKKYVENKNPNPHAKTFKQFAEPLLGKEYYHHFITCCGYQDFENGDAHDFFYDYGFEDIYSTWTAVSVSWTQLIDRLVEKIGPESVKASHNVVKLEEQQSIYLLETKKHEKTFFFKAKKVVLATRIQGLLNLVPTNKSIYKQIHGQPFLRVYGKFDKKSAMLMEQKVPVTTIVPGPLKKVIPYDAEKGVYMISYTDNEGATDLKDNTENTEKNRELFSRLLEISLGLPEKSLRLTSLLSFYWSVGTHYYSPLRSSSSLSYTRKKRQRPNPSIRNRKDFLKKAQHPQPGLFVVGEVVSIDTGWTNGALDSVEKVFQEIIQ